MTEGKYNLEYNDAVPLVRSSIGIDDLGTVIRTIDKNKEFFEMIIGLFKNIFKKKQTKPTEPVEIPPIVIPAPVTLKPLPSASERNVESLVSKWYFVERKEDPNNPKSPGKPISKSEFQEVLSGSSPVSNRDRVHIDTTPLDQNGEEFEPDTPGLEQLGSRDENTTVKHHVIWDGVDQGDEGTDNVDITSEYNDFGMTPVLKIHDVTRSEEHTLSYYAMVTTTKGKSIKSNNLPTIRVKPWND